MSCAMRSCSDKPRSRVEPVGGGGAARAAPTRRQHRLARARPMEPNIAIRLLASMRCRIFTKRNPLTYVRGSFVSFIAGARDGVAGTKLLFFGGGCDPGGDGARLFDGVAFFVAIVFAVGEGVILGRDAVGKFEIAIGLLGRVDGALEFAE